MHRLQKIIELGTAERQGGHDLEYKHPAYNQPSR